MADGYEGIVTVCCSDIAGQVRGKGFPASDLEKRRRFGVGWTPTNVMINCFGRIPATPFGAEGDLMLVPASGGDIRLESGPGLPLEHIILGDILTMAGEPWECCLRSLLARALRALEEEAGLRLVASFEHEFWYERGEERPGDSYAASSLRGMEGFISEFLAALRVNDIAPDTFLPEYGPRQYEITIDPAEGLVAADQAVKLREICRSVARRHGSRASFSPVVTHGIVGNGVHIHFSLTDLAGLPVGFDDTRPGKMSEVCASFCAGILRHARALCALTAPSVISYERLKPHSWSAYYANLADRDREALLRICPYPEVEGLDVSRRFNIEYRGADAAASPHLQLAALVFAGLEGVREALPSPFISTGDPGRWSDAERAERGITDLPRSLGEALDALEGDGVIGGCLGSVLTQAYVMHKRGEIEMASKETLADLCSLYAEAY
ncbi:type III glutamate--ammonia ligase [Labrys miyagiensis]